MAVNPRHISMPLRAAEHGHLPPNNQEVGGTSFPFRHSVHAHLQLFALGSIQQRTGSRDRGINHGPDAAIYFETVQQAAIHQPNPEHQKAQQPLPSGLLVQLCKIGFRALA